MSYNIIVKEDYIRECKKLQPKLQKRINDFIFKTLPVSENPLLLFEKMKGYVTFYKKRFGDFRLGVEIIQSEKKIIVLKIMNRKEIYRHFPP